MPPTTNPDDLRLQRISTRLFILLLTVALSILVIYTSASVVVKTITIDDPSVEKYEELYAEHSQSLACPCTKITTSYGTFVEVKYAFHEICSSSFVTDSWIGYIKSSHVGLLASIDFRWIGMKMFQGLRDLCYGANQSIADSLIQFYANEHVTAATITADKLQSTSKTLVDQFIATTTSRYVLLARVVRDTTQANALMSAFQTNALVFLAEQLYNSRIEIQIYGQCTCEMSSQCIQEIAIYHDSFGVSYWLVPGFFLGCYILEALRQSRFECLYNQTCLDQLQANMRSSTTVDVTPLDASRSSKFSPNTPISEVIDNLMVEQWDTVVMYEKYYNSCQPARCTYTMSTRNDAVQIVTTVIGLVGGLVTVLKLLVPRAVRLVSKCLSRRRRRVMVGHNVHIAPVSSMKDDEMIVENIEHHI